MPVLSTCALPLLSGHVARVHSVATPCPVHPLPTAGPSSPSQHKNRAPCKAGGFAFPFVSRVVFPPPPPPSCLHAPSVPFHAQWPRSPSPPCPWLARHRERLDLRWSTATLAGLLMRALNFILFLPCLPSLCLQTAPRRHGARVGGKGEGESEGGKGVATRGEGEERATSIGTVCSSLPSQPRFRLALVMQLQRHCIRCCGT